jgi:hypothetical protein
MISPSISSEPKYIGTKPFCEPHILYIVGFFIGSGSFLLITFKIFPESQYPRNTNHCSYLSKISFKQSPWATIHFCQRLQKCWKHS